MPDKTAETCQDGAIAASTLHKAGLPAMIGIAGLLSYPAERLGLRGCSHHSRRPFLCLLVQFRF